MAISIRCLEEHAAAEALLEAHGKAVVTGPSAVVRQEDPTEGWVRDTFGNRNGTRRVKGWGVLIPALGKLLARIAHVSHIEEQVVREEVLDIEVPLLDVRGAIALVDAEGNRGSAP